MAQGREYKLLQGPGRAWPRPLGEGSGGLGAGPQAGKGLAPTGASTYVWRLARVQLWRNPAALALLSETLLELPLEEDHGHHRQGH